jgi:hypothetical protein
VDCDQQGYGKARKIIASTDPTGKGWMTQQTPKTYTRPTYPKKRPKGRIKARWKDAVDNYIRKMEIFNWREVAKDRNEWRRVIAEALALLGQWGHRRSRRKRDKRNCKF